MNKSFVKLLQSCAGVLLLSTAGLSMAATYDYDFDGDGKKDITYSDTGMDPYTSPTNEIKNKTVFIRSGNKFIEKDFFQFDPYAKSLKIKYYK